MKSLYDKHRPKTFEDVVGQKSAVASLRRVLDKKTSQSFILSGPSGTGKTTLARIAAYQIGCRDEDIIEIDAATHTGVESMREVQEVTRYKPIGKSSHRAIIVDEAHRLSGQAWDSLLKVVEEPPAHVMWFFCTTLFAKVPQTIKTRCTSIPLKEVNDDDIADLVDRVAKIEKIRVSDDVFNLIVREAHGSPRQALVNLAACDGVKNRKQAAEVLRTAVESDATIELCRFLVKGGGSWIKAMAIVDELGDANPEGVRIVVVNYLGAVLKKASNDKRAVGLLMMLEAFAQPYNQSEGKSPLLLSIGRCLFD